MNDIAKPVGIIGAGTMGAGIAQSAAAAGWTVFLMDVDKDVLDQSIKIIEDRVQRLTDLQRISIEQSELMLKGIVPTTNKHELQNCDFIIESVDEDLNTKIEVLQEASTISPNAVLATNTSSLSVTRIASGTNTPERVVGTHFFNPAAIMPLVEIVKGAHTSETTASCATLIIEAWGKTTVHPTDSPGFIVNRVARPFYLEAWRIFHESIATVETIDASMQLLGEFRMGPFQLMDLLGHDFSFATSQRIFNDLGKPSRLAPCDAQSKLIADGHLGRKTGCGAYTYSNLEKIVPAIHVDCEELEIPEHLAEVINSFCVEAASSSGNKLEKYIFSRIVVAIMNEALWARADGVGSAEDIDIAMKLGTNYPKGPLEWYALAGIELVHELLSAFNSTVNDNRFLSPPRLVGENS